MSQSDNSRSRPGGNGARPVTSAAQRGLGGAPTQRGGTVPAGTGKVSGSDRFDRRLLGEGKPGRGEG